VSRHLRVSASSLSPRRGFLAVPAVTPCQANVYAGFMMCGAVPGAVPPCQSNVYAGFVMLVAVLQPLEFSLQPCLRAVPPVPSQCLQGFCQSRNLKQRSEARDQRSASCSRRRPEGAIANRREWTRIGSDRQRKNQRRQGPGALFSVLTVSKHGTRDSRIARLSFIAKLRKSSWNRSGPLVKNLALGVH